MAQVRVGASECAVVLGGGLTAAMFGRKKKRHTDPPEFWDVEEPYSQVKRTREIRILGEGVTREFYFVYAEVNPGTYRLIEKYSDRLKPDQEFAARFLTEAELRDDGEGFEWHVYGSEAHSPKDAEKATRELVKTVIALHELAVKFREIELSEDG